jgi:glycosyltransferase involved in cell wall biosynthesis
MYKVSVIVPNYNHALYLPQRIDSILSQTYKDFELILMDDNSSDDSRRILESYDTLPNVRLVFNETNSGSSFKQWNKGMKQSSGEYIWIAESDDIAEKEFLSTLVQILDNNPEVAIAYTQSYEINEKGDITGNWFNFTKELHVSKWSADFIMPGNEMIKKYMIYHNCLPNASAVLFRKSSAQKIGMADESFKLNGDWLFWVMLMEKSSLAFVAKPLNYFRKHNSTVRSTLLKIGTGIYEYSKVLKYICYHTDIDKKTKRHVLLSYFINIKRSPVFEQWSLEGKVFITLLKTYCNFIICDRSAIRLCCIHFLRRFCSFYIRMLFKLKVS